MHRIMTLVAFTRPTRTIRLLASSRSTYRAYSSSSPSSSSVTPATKDDSHPHLYFHHLADKRRIALSYLATPPKIPHSKGVIGWLPNDASAGVGDFKENTEFR